MLILTVFFGLLPLYGQNARNTPIDVNLIIDGSGSLSGVKNDVISWISRSVIERKLIAGDRVTVWNAGQSAKIIYSETIKNDSDREAIKKSIQYIMDEQGYGNHYNATADEIFDWWVSKQSYNIFFENLRIQGKIEFEFE